MAPAAEEMAQAAINFWNALAPEQQAKARYEMKDEERYDWHFIPKPRKGLPIREMTPAQRDLAHAFLASGLSRRGYQQAVTIMSLDQILKEMENGKGPVRDPDGYFFTVFGTPGPGQTWGWRVEGHHLSLNFTIADGKAVAAGPTFMGSNPGEVREGPRKGLRVLGATEDMGRKLVKSLDDEQRKTAVIEGDAPKEVITGNSRKADPGPPAGLAAEKMNAEQQRAVDPTRQGVRPPAAFGAGRAGPGARSRRPAGTRSTSPGRADWSRDRSTTTASRGRRSWSSTTTRRTTPTTSTPSGATPPTTSAKTCSRGITRSTTRTRDSIAANVPEESCGTRMPRRRAQEPASGSGRLGQPLPGVRRHRPRPAKRSPRRAGRCRGSGRRPIPLPTNAHSP